MLFRSPSPVEALYRRFVGSEKSEAIISFKDALRLYQLGKQSTRALDLGTGIGTSSAVLALAGTKVVTLEQSGEFTDAACERIPADLKERVTFIVTPVYAYPCFAPYQYCAGYRDLPREPFDLVVLDGPAPWQEAGGTVDLPTGDILGLLDVLPAGAKVYLDGRKPTLWLYRKHLSDRLPIIESGKGYAIFEKR